MGVYKKIPLIATLVVVLLAGTVFGALVAKYVWTTNMGMRLVASYDIALEYTNGTEITAYDWGDFAPGETKQLNATLLYKGNNNGIIFYNTTTLPAGWDLTIHIDNTETGVLWNQTLALEVNHNLGTPIVLSLTEVNAVENQLENFDLNFTSYKEVTT